MVARVTTLTDTVRRRPPLVAARAASGAFARASAAGNRSLQIDSAARTTYAYDAANQTRYSQDGTGRTTFTFDNAGNQRIELSPALARTTNVWDYENRRRAAIDPSTGATTFTYRPDALRVKSQDVTSTTKFIWDEQRVLTETDDSNTAQVVYTSEPAGHGNLISQRRLSGGIWTPYVHLYDALGSTDRLTDANQAVANSYVYKAFGVLAASSGSVSNLAQFVGRLGYATQTAGTYVQARWYECHHGRWVAVDPAGIVSNLNLSVLQECNLYMYASNCPVNLTDPTGLWPLCSAEVCGRVGPAGNPEGVMLYRVEVIGANSAGTETRCGVPGLKIRFSFKDTKYLGPGNRAGDGGGPCGQPAQRELDQIYRDRRGFTFGDIAQRGCTVTKALRRKDQHGCWVLDFEWECPVECLTGRCGPTNPYMGIFGPLLKGETPENWRKPHYGISHFSIHMESRITYTEPCPCIMRACTINASFEWRGWLLEDVSDPNNPKPRSYRPPDDCTAAERERARTL